MSKITGGTVDCGASNLAIVDGSLQEKVTNEDDVDSDSPTQDGLVIEEQLPVAIALTGRVVADWDAAATPHANPPNIKAGSAVALKCYVGLPKSSYYDVPVAQIDTVDVTFTPKKKVRYTFDWHSNGAWTRAS